MRSKNIFRLVVIIGLLLSGLILSGSMWWAESFGNSGIQERKKRNLKDEVLTVIDAAPDEAAPEKKAARSEKEQAV
jgi:hypothetical protein